MKLLNVLALGVVLSTPVFAGQLDAVSFMQGCWGTTDDQHQKVTEDWYKSAGNVMLGVSQTINGNGAMEQYEFLQLRSDSATQKITYTPYLNGKRLNTFVLDAAASKQNKVTFSDPSNATLKSLTYSLISQNVLNVRLIGTTSAGTRFDFAYDMKRVDCRSRF